MLRNKRDWQENRLYCLIETKSLKVSKTVGRRFESCQARFLSFSPFWPQLGISSHVSSFYSMESNYVPESKTTETGSAASSPQDGACPFTRTWESSLMPGISLPVRGQSMLNSPYQRQHEMELGHRRIIDFRGGNVTRAKV